MFGDRIVHPSYALNKLIIFIHILELFPFFIISLLKAYHGCNDVGHLSRRQVVLANNVSDSFPNPEVLLLYAKPLTSWSPGQKQPNTTRWIPREVNLSRLAAICECSFTWATLEGILSCFQEHVWPGMALHGLVKVG